MLLDEEEENCIHHLKKFEVEEFSDVTAGFYLKFGFNDNPYFENDLLVKEYHFGVGKYQFAEIIVTELELYLQDRLIPC